MGQARIFTPENRFARVVSSLRGVAPERLVADLLRRWVAASLNA